jgi:hypothetical protein
MPAEELPFEGTDDTGAVTVTVDRAGLVTDLALTPTWRQKLAPDQLAHAMTTAANQAISDRLAHEHAQPWPDATPIARQDARNAGGDPSSTVARTMMDEITSLLADFPRDLDTYRGDLSEAASATATARGTRSKITVSMSHWRVDIVTVDPRWAESAENTAIRVEALDAFTAAGRHLADADPRAVTPPASIARLLRLVADRPALTTELGLS